MEQNNQPQKNGLSWTDTPKPVTPAAPAQSQPVPPSTPTPKSNPTPAPKQPVKQTAPGAPEPSKKNLGLTFAGGIVLCALIIWGVTALRSDDTKSPTDTTDTPSQVGTDTSEPDTTEVITVEDQAAGKNVAVSGLALTEPTWIVVYDEKDGAPAGILGAVLVFPPQTSTLVPLVRATVSGNKYLVGQSMTNAGSHIFSRETTKPLEIWGSFTAQ